MRRILLLLALALVLTACSSAPKTQAVSIEYLTLDIPEDMVPIDTYEGEFYSYGNEEAMVALVYFESIPIKDVMAFDKEEGDALSEPVEISDIWEEATTGDEAFMVDDGDRVSFYISHGLTIYKVVYIFNDGVPSWASGSYDSITIQD